MFRGLGPKPTEEEMRKKKSRKWWWLRELFFCFGKNQPQTNFIDILHENKKDDKGNNRTDSYDTLNNSAISLGPFSFLRC